MDNETAAALAAVQSVFDRPELHVELGFAPGQIQYVNNRATGHARTEFVDFPEPERKRHLVRLWLRDAGRRGYCGWLCRRRSSAGVDPKGLKLNLINLDVGAAAVT